MLYLNNIKLAIIYFIFTTISSITPFILYYTNLVSNTPIFISYILITPIYIVGTIHCFNISRKFNHNIILKWYSTWYTIFCIFIISPMIFKEFYETFHNPSFSMEPNLKMGDYFFIKKHINKEHLQRGDIIIFKLSSNPNILYVKRLIGLPHDKIEIDNGKLYLNNKILKHQYIEGYDANNKKFKKYRETLLSKKSYYTLGNTNSHDEQLYIIPNNKYFVLGDNREESHDSRFNDIGLISKDDIVGKISLIFGNSQRK